MNTQAFNLAVTDAINDPAFDAIVRAERRIPYSTAVAILRRPNEVYTILRVGEFKSNRFTLADERGWPMIEGKMCSYGDVAFNLIHHGLGDVQVEAANKESEQGAKRLARLLRERRKV